MIYERKYNGMKTSSELIKINQLNKEQKYPITQASCICYNNDNEILIISDKPGKWIIPGGKPETNESIEETVKREVLEEACVEIKDVKLLGFMKIHLKNNPNKFEGDNFLQARFAGKISKILEPKKDPATGQIFDRKFIQQSEFTEFINWSEAKELIELFQKILNP